jgi:hypothetical protein
VQFKRDDITLGLVLNVVGGILTAILFYGLGKLISLKLAASQWVIAILIGLVAGLVIWIWRSRGAMEKLMTAHNSLMNRADLQREKIQQLENAARVLTDYVALDDSLLRLLPRLVAAPDRSAAIAKVLDELLQDLMEVFAHQRCRASILRVDGDYLVPWPLGSLPTASTDHKFYIGRRNGRKWREQQGVAGYVYLERKHAVVHLSWQGDHWKADHNMYRTFSSATRHNSQYETFIAIPLEIELDLTGVPKCFGVLCLDSMAPNCFDNPEIQGELVPGLAKRIASVIAVYHLLERSTQVAS